MNTVDYKGSVGAFRVRKANIRHRVRNVEINAKIQAEVPIQGSLD